MNTCIEIPNNQTPNSQLQSPGGPPAPEEPPSAEGAPSSQELLPPGPSPLPPLLHTQAKNPLAIVSSIGELDLRTPSEDIEFQECEVIVREGWGHFARMGEALARIRDKQLYKNEYPSFEVYCRERWGFGHTQTWRYISAAKVQQTLGTVPGIPMPESEAQIRPLIGLPAELAQQAWLLALGWSRDGYVPAQMVRRAVKQVVKTEQPAVAAESNAKKQQRSRLRQSVRTGFQELLTLLLKSAEREVLLAKVQEIQRLLDPLLNPKKTKG